MNMFPSVARKYTEDRLSASEAQRLAQFIAWSPVVFQVSRLMIKFGILDLLRNSDKGLTLEEIADGSRLSIYAVKILTDASLSVGTITVDMSTNRFSLSKVGWFLLTDIATRTNMDFNQDVNYQGLFYLEEALKEGRPAGLKCLSHRATIYEALSELPEMAQKSWFRFDHFYSDGSFEEALNIVFKQRVGRLMDVGGNTGRFALRCVKHSKEVQVTVVDLPGQIEMMRKNIANKLGSDRIEGFAANLLAAEECLPQGKWDVIWMSQFLDCFSEEQICSLLRKASQVMNPETRLYIMETFWDRQRFETASLCLTMTSVYFTAIANGNSKMYHSDDMMRQITKAGLTVVKIHDHIGQGHTILEVSKQVK